ncbi:MAG TPA: AgmX/PglI C-terminal domain-containing protein [Polyangiaceae bacterium]
MSPQTSRPPSRPPAGVPSGNAKYAIVVVVLLLGVGGLFYWRSHGGAETPVTPVPTVPSTIASTAPTNPKLDDIPPPPPVEEKPEAGPGGTKVVYAAAGGGCEATCTGTSPPELGQALQVRAAQARRCYNSALASDSSLRGHVTIAVKVASNGSVCSANVAANDMGSPSVAGCAANIFRNASYPAPHGGCVVATVPMSFVPMGQ